MVWVYRVRVDLAGDPGKALPWGYRSGVLGWLYGVMEAAGLPRDGHRSRYSLFTFSLQPAEPLRGPEGLRSASGGWVLRVASAREEVLRALEGLPEVADFGVPMRVLGVALEPLADKAVFQAVEPILVMRPDGAFVTPEEDDFSRGVRECLVRRYRYWAGRDPEGEVLFSFTGRPRRHLVRVYGRDYLAFGGPVRVSAPRELRLFAQCVGLGRKPSCGLGMVV